MFQTGVSSEASEDIVMQKNATIDRHWNKTTCYLTIIPRARMGSESSYWLRGHEGERNNCFSKIQLVGQKYRE